MLSISFIGQEIEGVFSIPKSICEWKFVVLEMHMLKMMMFKLLLICYTLDRWIWLIASIKNAW